MCLLWGACRSLPARLPPCRYVCTNDIHPTHVRVHAFGQFLSRYYRSPQLPHQIPRAEAPGAPASPPTDVRQQSLGQKPAGHGQQQGQRGRQDQQPTLLPPVSIIRQLGLQPQRGQTQQGMDLQLRVLFSKRSSGDRRLLNSAELLRRCNAWRYTAPSGARLRALCWEVRRGPCQGSQRGRDMGSNWPFWAAVWGTM